MVRPPRTPTPAATIGSSDERAGERRHAPLLPGFSEMATRRQSLLEDLVARRIDLGLTQTEVAARMGTSQSAVARLEAGSSDARLSTVERYAAAVGQQVDWSLREPGGRDASRGTEGRPPRPQSGGPTRGR